MSEITQIEAAIEKLAPDEFAELAAWINARQTQVLTRSNFDEAMDKVFDHHARLLEKLAH